MTRLESAARDYAIACIARGGLTPQLGCLPDVADAYCDALVERLVDIHHGKPVPPLRILRARVALYLRLLRRCEAWDRYGKGRLHWSSFESECHRGRGYYIFGPDTTAVPWRPLWLDAPAHDPTITPKMRREKR